MINFTLLETIICCNENDNHIFVQLPMQKSKTNSSLGETVQKSPKSWKAKPRLVCRDKDYSSIKTGGKGYI